MTDASAPGGSAAGREPDDGGYYVSEQGHKIKLSRDGIKTISRPERPAYLLILGLCLFSFAIVLVSFLTTGEEMGGAGFWLTTGFMGLTFIGTLWLVSVAVVRVEADLENGIRVSTMQFFNLSLPWEAVESIKEGMTGGAMDVGYKRWGGGRVGFLAGSQTIIITVSEAYRGKQLTPAGKTQRVAQEYFISVPESSAVSAKLKELRARAQN